MVSLGAWSLWQEEVQSSLGAWTSEDVSSSTADKSSCHTLVVGAGLAGSACAAALARVQTDVLLVDAHGPGTGASGRNAGFVLLGNAVEYPQLVARFGRETCRLVLDAARRNHALIRENYAQVCDYELSGSLMLSMQDDPKEIEALREATDLLREDGVDLKLGDPHACLHGFHEQLTLAEDGQVHPAKLTMALAKRCPRRAQATITHFDWAAGVAHTDAGGTIRFERCVIATNAYTQALLPELATKVSPERGQVLATAPLSQRVLPEVAYAAWGYDYFRQRADGRVILGGRRHILRDQESTDDASPTPAMQDELDAYLARHLPFAADAPITHRWAGIMGFSHDELPYVDAVPDTGGRASIIAAFTGHGLGLTVACGEALAGKLLGDADEDARALVGLLSLGRDTPSA